MYNWVMLTLVNNCYDLNGQEPEEESPAQS